MLELLKAACLKSAILARDYLAAVRRYHAERRWDKEAKMQALADRYMRINAFAWERLRKRGVKFWEIAAN